MELLAEGGRERRLGKRERKHRREKQKKKPKTNFSVTRNSGGKKAEAKREREGRLSRIGGRINITLLQNEGNLGYVTSGHNTRER